MIQVITPGQISALFAAFLFIDTAFAAEIVVTKDLSQHLFDFAHHAVDAILDPAHVLLLGFWYKAKRPRTVPESAI
jgi:hypothetical protein